MVSLKQELDIHDYFGPLVVFVVFFVIVFVITMTVILWCCVSDADDVSVGVGKVCLYCLSLREGGGVWSTVHHYTLDLVTFGIYATPPGVVGGSGTALSATSSC